MLLSFWGKIRDVKSKNLQNGKLGQKLNLGIRVRWLICVRWLEKKDEDFLSFVGEGETRKKKLQRWKIELWQWKKSFDFRVKCMFSFLLFIYELMNVSWFFWFSKLHFRSFDFVSTMNCESKRKMIKPLTFLQCLEKSGEEKTTYWGSTK